MFWLIEEFEAIDRFLGLGGDVLKVIFLLTFGLWVLVLERNLFFFFELPKISSQIKQDWLARQDKSSWYARHIRRELISRVAVQSDQGLGMIKVMIALCPLLGLLGTVVGMVSVFDVLAVTGTGSPRAMASGISQATIPTMAGMVAALSGLYFNAQLEKRADRARHEIADSLVH